MYVHRSPATYRAPSWRRGQSREERRPCCPGRGHPSRSCSLLLGSINSPRVQGLSTCAPVRWRTLSFPFLSPLLLTQHWCQGDTLGSGNLVDGEDLFLSCLGTPTHKSFIREDPGPLQNFLRCQSLQVFDNQFVTRIPIITVRGPCFAPHVARLHSEGLRPSVGAGPGGSGPTGLSCVWGTPGSPQARGGLCPPRRSPCSQPPGLHTRPRPWKGCPTLAWP